MSFSTLLTANNLVKSFGGLIALNDVSLEVNQGDILGLIGPNGSGKTTLVNTITGIIKQDKGEINFLGDNISKLKAHKRVHKGINRTYQVPKPFNKLTVSENILIPTLYGKDNKNVNNNIYELLELVGLYQYKDKLSQDLNSTQQKLLDIARALATEPKLVFVDEIAAGLNPKETKEIAKIILKLSKIGVTFVVIEHIMQFLKLITNRVVVMDTGKIIFNGDLKSAQEDSNVINVFLGGKKYS